MLSQILIDDFHKYFFGNDKAFGQFTITGNKDKKGKIPGKGKTVSKDIKKQNFIDHLEGKTGLGIAPINQNSQCRFGVLDIDDYTLDIGNLIEDINKLNLPLVTIRSKSGGAHLYLFLEGFVNAETIIDILSLFGSLLGYNDIEIFPKQKELKPGASGNWINLPYFNYEKTERYILDRDNKKLDLYEGLKLVKSTSKDISELNTFIGGLPFKDGPPCLQKLYLRGVLAGNRDIFLFNLTIYFKQKYPDDWEGKLVEVNRTNPEPLPYTEINKIILSVTKKEYFYQCSEGALKGVCNKSVCRLREFGINNASIPSEVIGSLKKIIFHSDEVVWELEVNNQILRFETTNEVMKHGTYQEKCMEQLNIWPRPVKPNAWRKIISNRLGELTEETGPEELSNFGQFKELLQSFLKTANIAVTRDQMLSKNKIFFNSETKLCYFRGLDLVNFVQLQKMFWLNRTKVWQYLNELNAKNTQMKISYINSDGESIMERIKVWRLDYHSSELYRDIEVDIPINIKDVKELEDKNEAF